MTAKEYLSQVRLLDLKIDHKLEEKAYLRALAEGNGSQKLSRDRVQTSISGDKMGSIVDRYVDLEKEIDRMIDEYVDKRDHIINQIHMVEGAKYVELLKLKYIGVRNEDTGRIKYLRLEEIACTMLKSDGTPYSYEHVRSMHGEALRRFTEIM